MCIQDTTMLATLTVADLKEILRDLQSEKRKEDAKPSGSNLVYGIRGIERLFNVSHRTAQSYKNSFLKPAVCQNGRKIVVDRDLALKLFAEHEEKGGAR